jgi:hypothetical protein
VALVRTDVSEEPGASFIRVTKIGELGTTQAATSNRRMLQRNTKTETSVLTRATRRNNPEDTILHSHRRENLKSYYMGSSIIYLNYFTQTKSCHLLHMIPVVYIKQRRIFTQDYWGFGFHQ